MEIRGTNVVALFSIILVSLNASSAATSTETHHVDNENLDFTTQKYGHCYGEGEPHLENQRRKRNAVEVPGSYNGTYNATDTNGTVQTDALGKLSEEFKGCMHWTLEKGCYEVLENGSVFVPIYLMVFNDSSYFIRDDGILLLCPIDIIKTEDGKFDNAFNVLTTFGLGISIVCIILHMIMFCLVSTLRNLPGYCLISLCVALLKAYTGFMIRGSGLLDKHSCQIVALISYYFFLASFFWMNVLSFDVWRSLRLATAKLRLTTRVRIRFAMYSLYSWGVPGMIMVFSVIINTVGMVPEKYRLELDESKCWFGFRSALLVYLGIPIFTLLALNLVFFGFSFFMISSASMKNDENRAVLWSRFSIFLRLAIIMGLTWVLGAVAAATDEMALWYIFVIFNSSQGIMIFLSFSLNQKTKIAWKNRFRGRKSSTPTQVCSTQSNQGMTCV